MDIRVNPILDLNSQPVRFLLDCESDLTLLPYAEQLPESNCGQHTNQYHEACNCFEFFNSVMCTLLKFVTGVVLIQLGTAPSSHTFLLLVGIYRMKLSGPWLATTPETGPRLCWQPAIG